MKTVAQRIIDILGTMDRPATRSELAEKVGISNQVICKPLSKLSQLGEIHVIPRGFGSVTMFELCGRAGNQHAEFIRRVAMATRYKTGDKLLIDAKYADEAKALLR